MLLRTLALLVALVATAAADPHAERLWTGKNGKSFRGAYLGTDKATGKYEFVLGTGTTYLIDPENLSEKDQQWLHAELHPEIAEDPNKGDWINFLADPEFDRTTLPVIDQADYGNKASDCVPSSFCNFLLWWDQLGYLPIDKKGDFDRKAEHVHDRMARYFRTRNNAGTSMNDAEQGVHTYFQRDLEELATCRVLTDHNCAPENLRRYAAGASATLLELTTYYGDRYHGGHVVALSHLDANDDLIFITWGARLRGRLKILEKDLPLRRATTSHTAHKYELEIMNRADLPEWAADNEVRFIIDPQQHDGLMIITPYRYKEQGKPFPAPPDPLMQPPPPGRPKRTPPKRPPTPSLTPPPLPHKFVQPASFSREWTNTAGTPLQGRLLSANDTEVVLKTDTQHVTIPLAELSPPDQARVLLWKGINGQTVSLRAARLDYLLTRGDDISYPAKVFLDGTRFRLELPFVKPTRIIVGDIQAGTFLIHWDKKRDYIGRLAEGYLLPAPPKGSDLSLWEGLRDQIPSTRLSPHPDWPCRVTSWTSPEDRSGFDLGGNSFQNPAMLFSAVEAPTLLAALKTLLSPPSIQKEGDSKQNSYYGIMTGKQPSNGHSGASELLGFCHTAHLMPLRLQWTNTYNPKSKYAKYRKPLAGTFRLELTGLTLGPQEKSLFEIPSAAEEIAIGRFRELKANN